MAEFCVVAFILKIWWETRIPPRAETDILIIYPMLNYLFYPWKPYWPSQSNSDAIMNCGFLSWEESRESRRVAQFASSLTIHPKARNYCSQIFLFNIFSVVRLRISWLFSDKDNKTAWYLCPKICGPDISTLQT
jgi:hypothetical protein